jgi:hypothetical protein
VVVEEEHPNRHFPNIATLEPGFGSPEAVRNPLAPGSAPRATGPPLS